MTVKEHTGKHWPFIANFGRLSQSCCFLRSAIVDRINTGESRMMKKSVLVHTLILVIFVFLFGCGNHFSETELLLQQQAEEAARGLLEEKFQESPDNFAVIDYEIDPQEDFQLVEIKDDTYIIRGGSAFTYGYNRQQPILNVTVEADLAIKQSGQGKWSMEEFRPKKIESDGEKNRNGWTNSIDGSSYVPFISKKSAEEKQMDITRIAQELVYKLMLELNNCDGEKETFMLSANVPDHSLEMIEVPDGKNADAVWRFGGNITGNFVGYIQGLGYAGPLLQSDFPSEEQPLNQEPLYLLKKSEGYYLETSRTFWGRQKER